MKTVGFVGAHDDEICFAKVEKLILDVRSKDIVEEPDDEDEDVRMCTGHPLDFMYALLDPSHALTDQASWSPKDLRDLLC